MEPIILLLILIFGIAVIVLQIAAIRRLSAQNAKNEELTRMLQQENDKLKNFLLQQNSDLRRELNTSLAKPNGGLFPNPSRYDRAKSPSIK